MRIKGDGDDGDGCMGCAYCQTWVAIGSSLECHLVTTLEFGENWRFWLMWCRYVV